ncbi:unnamed protein product, partial [Nesidiocoris tenuis]
MLCNSREGLKNLDLVRLVRYEPERSNDRSRTAAAGRWPGSRLVPAPPAASSRLCRTLGPTTRRSEPRGRRFSHDPRPLGYVSPWRQQPQPVGSVQEAADSAAQPYAQVLPPIAERGAQESHQSAHQE